MPAQTNVYPKAQGVQMMQSSASPEPEKEAPITAGYARSAPVWLQRLSLVLLVVFCLYLGVIVAVLPWWTRIWEANRFVIAHPHLDALLHNGAIRGILTGIGLLDIWIGISEAIHYRDYRG